MQDADTHRTSKYHLTKIIRSDRNELYTLMETLERGRKKPTFDKIKSNERMLGDLMHSLNPIEKKVFDMNGREQIDAPLTDTFSDGRNNYLVSLPLNPKHSKISLTDRVLKELEKFIRDEVTSLNRSKTAEKKYDVYRLGSLKSSPRKFVENTLVACIGYDGYLLTFVAIFKNGVRDVYLFDGCNLL